MTLTDITQTKLKSREEINKEVDEVINENDLFFTNIRRTWAFWNNFWEIYRPNWTYSWFWKDLYRKYISTILFPRQRWLTKVIPRTYSDKDYLLEIIVIKILTDFVESEIGVKELFDENRWKNADKYSKYQIKFEKELKENYLLITHKIPELKKDLEREWNLIPHFNLKDLNNKKFSYKKTYGKIDLIQKNIDDTRTKIMIWVTKNRKSMWS